MKKKKEKLQLDIVFEASSMAGVVRAGVRTT